MGELVRGLYSTEWTRMQFFCVGFTRVFLDVLSLRCKSSQWLPMSPPMKLHRDSLLRLHRSLHRSLHRNLPMGLHQTLHRTLHQYPLMNLHLFFPPTWLTYIPEPFHEASLEKSPSTKLPSIPSPFLPMNPHSSLHIHNLHISVPYIFTHLNRHATFSLFCSLLFFLGISDRIVSYGSRDNSATIVKSLNLLNYL